VIEFKDIREHEVSQVTAWLATLAANLRRSDLDEITATHALDPVTSLMTSARLSEMAWVILWNGEPVAIFGAAPTPCPDSGLVWMMGTPGMDDRRPALTIARMTRPYLAVMHRRFPCLWNYIDARNEKSMNWLKWSGFNLLEAHPEHGREKRLFFTFGRFDPQNV
jgi:hypothetical protein